MKDMGEASYVIGVKILRDHSKRLLSLSQETYIKKMLQRYHMHDCKPMDTPIERNLSLNLDMCPQLVEEKEQMSKASYSSAIHSLMYAMMCKRPDICYVIGLASRFQSDPGMKHWMAVKRILRYLKGIADYALCYHMRDLQLIGYTYSNWGSDLDQRKSTSGYAFLLNDCEISWEDQKYPN